MSGQPLQAEKGLTPPAIPENPTFVDFPCFSVDPAFRRLPAAEQKEGIRGFVETLAQSRKDLQVRSYLGIGLRHDTDFFFWAIAKDLAPFQDFAADLMRTRLGHYLKSSYNFLAMTRPSQYNPGHLPAFEAGEAPRKYLFLYPFVKSREWYLLPFEERRRMMRGHMSTGELYPMVRLNTTYSFGLGDQDFVLAFETDQPAAFEDLVQRLRESEASRYTVRDTPFILGQRCADGEALIKGLGL
ncbi:MAG: chlorite dismutase family protein [Candidatus Omnitrophota bacterium]|nr:chlorite dismutase family protein [Candidatus Omnitrophota bacterium]